MPCPFPRPCPFEDLVVVGQARREVRQEAGGSAEVIEADDSDGEGTDDDSSAGGGSDDSADDRDMREVG